MMLSIVIPAFNEESKIENDIQTASKFMTDHDISGEIIVVDDGSRDKTAQKAQKTCSGNVPLRVIRSETNRGKGHAVRTGMLNTSGQIVMFADSGCCVPYKNALVGMEMLKNNQCEIAHGSRKMPGCKIIKAQNWYRKLFSKLFRTTMRFIMKIPYHYTDTQCGFKVYKGDIARTLYDACITDGFMFDVETIIRAQDMNYRICEFPVEWTNDRDSRLSVFRTTWRVLSELYTIKRTIIRENAAKSTSPASE